MKKALKYGSYTLYAIFMAVALLYVHFPSEAFQSYLSRAAGRMDPPVIFKTGSLDPSFPPGLQFVNPVFSRKERPETAFFEAQELSVRPGIASLLLGNATWFFDARAYGGIIHGHILPGKGGKIDDFALSLENVRIHEYPSLPQFGGDLAGNLRADISYKGPPDRIANGEGTGDILISEGKIELKNPLLGLKSIPFGELKARFALKKGSLNLASVSLDGKGFQGSLTGTIRLNRILERSQLNLRGTIEPIADYLATLEGGPALLNLFKGGQNGMKRSFVIQGTFRSPKFRFI